MRGVVKTLDPCFKLLSPHSFDGPARMERPCRSDGLARMERPCRSDGLARMERPCRFDGPGQFLRLKFPTSSPSAQFSSYNPPVDHIEVARWAGATNIMR